MNVFLCINCFNVMECLWEAIFIFIYVSKYNLNYIRFWFICFVNDLIVKTKCKSNIMNCYLSFEIYLIIKIYVIWYVKYNYIKIIKKHKYEYEIPILKI